MDAPQREKYWGEKNTDEKVEALKGELVKAYRLINGLSGMIERLIQHSHGLNGQMLSPFDKDDLTRRSHELKPWPLLNEDERR